MIYIKSYLLALFTLSKILVVMTVLSYALGVPLSLVVPLFVYLALVSAISGPISVCIDRKYN